MMYERKQLGLMLKRISEPRKTIMVISGPRQCGKTTAVGQMLKKCGIPFYSFSADNVNSQGNSWIVDCWDTARNGMDAKGEKEAILVIDEVQKINNWSEAVKAEWDYDKSQGRNLKVVLLGSSRLLLKKGLEDSLLGRFEKIDMTFWTFDEMHEAFGMTRDEYIYFGGFPGLYSYLKDETRWRDFMSNSIVAPFLQRDLMEIEEIRNPSLMSRVFSVGSALSSKEVSINSLQAGLSGGSNPTIKSYLELLDKTMMLKPLFKYRSSVVEKNNSAPKLQVYNNAFLTVSNNVNLEMVRSNNTLWGQWVESAVGAYLLNQSNVFGYEVMYWREKKNYKDRNGRTQQGQFEVDFVLKKGFSVVAIEVKSNRNDSLSGIEEFKKVFTSEGNDKLTSCLVVGNQGLTFEDFCRIDLGQLFVDKSLVLHEEIDTFPLSRLDKGQKNQLELLGRVNGTVWVDGDSYLIQKDENGNILKMKSREAFEQLQKNTPSFLSELGVSRIDVLKDLANGHTLTIGSERLYFDIKSKTLLSGMSYEEALVAEMRKKGNTISPEVKKRFGLK